jgi:hypothetical protein
MAFLSKYSFIIIWILVIVAAGAAFIFIVQPNLHLSTDQAANNAPAAAGANTAATASSTAPINPSVSLFIQKTKNGGTLFVQWDNLPGGTTALNIFRGLRNSTSGWSLWQSLLIGTGVLSNGSTSINLGISELGYSYFIEAVSGSSSGTASSSGSGSGPAVLWTSSVNLPVVVTSTPSSGGGPGGNEGGNNNQNSTSSPTTPNSNPTSSAPAQPTGNSTPPPPPSGIPYYSPNFKNTEYGTAQTGNFWVQHVDNKIQIGWQNLPPTTTDVVILRSANQDGPWNVVLSQQNPTINGSYSIQVIDDTLGAPYFYEMNAAVGSTTIATYGPTYLAGN